MVISKKKALEQKQNEKKTKKVEINPELENLINKDEKSVEEYEDEIQDLTD